MNKDSFTTSFTVAQSPEEAFVAIINPRLWWSGTHEGSSEKPGDTFAYRYKNLHYSLQKVTELVPGKRVAWHVLEATLSFLEDNAEWTGTTITFDIEKAAEGTKVTFTHVGLEPTIECYTTCSNAWSSLIHGSLRQLIETGKTDLLELDVSSV